MIDSRGNGRVGHHECAEVRRQLAVGAGPLAPRQAQHLRTCADCAGYAATLRRVATLTRQDEETVPAPAIETRLRQAVRQRRVRRSHQRVVRAVLAAAAVFAFALARAGTVAPGSAGVAGLGLAAGGWTTTEPESTRTDILRPADVPLAWRQLAAATEATPEGLFTR